MPPLSLLRVPLASSLVVHRLPQKLALEFRPPPQPLSLPPPAAEKGAPVCPASDRGFSKVASRSFLGLPFQLPHANLASSVQLSDAKVMGVMCLTTDPVCLQCSLPNPGRLCHLLALFRTAPLLLLGSWKLFEDLPGGLAWAGALLCVCSCS